MTTYRRRHDHFGVLLQRHLGERMCVSSDSSELIQILAIVVEGNEALS